MWDLERINFIVTSLFLPYNGDEEVLQWMKKLSKILYQ
nr:MAG TPA: hypothetical protein [Caudoviricetes sp.]